MKRLGITEFYSGADVKIRKRDISWEYLRIVRDVHFF